VNAAAPAGENAKAKPAREAFAVIYYAANDAPVGCRMLHLDVGPGAVARLKVAVIKLFPDDGIIAHVYGSRNVIVSEFRR
jgi:hypothetical protein